MLNTTIHYWQIGLRYMSLKEQILKMAYEVQLGAINSIGDTSNLLRKCLTICQMMKREVEWIKLELYGYADKWKTNGELMENAPKYRKTKLLFKDVHNRAILVADEFRSVADHVISQPITQIESEKYSGMIIMGGNLAIIRETFKVPIHSAEISGFVLKGLVETVRNRALEFANEIILEVQFGDMLSKIFDETKKFVDTNLIEVCPLAIEKLTTTYDNLATSSNSLEWSQIAFSCRDILQDFTQSIYNEDYIPETKQQPTRAETINKLEYTLRAKLNNTKKRERELIIAQMDYLLNYFRKLNDLIQKDIHPLNFEVKKEDANRCIVYTYMIIGDILKIIK